MTQYRHIFNSNTFAEVKYTGWWGFYDLNPKRTTSRGTSTDDRPGDRVARAGSTTPTATRDQVNASVTHYADKFGRHELKFGAEFEHSTTREPLRLHRAALYFYDYGGVPYYAYSYSYDISARNSRQSVFAQDAWHVDQPPDHQRRRARRHASRAAARAAATSTAATTGRRASASRCRPGRRQPHGDQGLVRPVLRRVAGAALRTARCPGSSDYVTYLVNADGSLGEISDVKPVVPVQGGRRHQASARGRGDDRLRAGARAGTMRLSLTGIWRDNKNFVNSVARRRDGRPSRSTTDLGQYADVLPVGEPRATSNTDYLIRNVEGFQYQDPNGNVIGTADPFRRYRAFMAVLNKRYTNRWQAQISYVLREGHRQRRQHAARRRSRRASSRRRTSRWSTRRARRATRRRTSSSCWGATRSRRSRRRSARTSRARADCLTRGSSSSRAATLNTTGLSSTYRRLNIAPRGARTTCRR